MRIWFKIWQDTHLLNDLVVENLEEDTRTHKIFNGLDEACVAFDVEHPIWLKTNIAEFKRRSKTRFNRDSFVSEVDFDYLEIEVLDED